MWGFQERERERGSPEWRGSVEWGWSSRIGCSSEGGVPQSEEFSRSEVLQSGGFSRGRGSPEEGFLALSMSR